VWLATKQASEGKVTIHSSDFFQRETLALVGDWSFFGQQLLDPDQVKESQKNRHCSKDVVDDNLQHTV
jgi:hypothetical protein